jgi:hypothetical protein
MSLMPRPISTAFGSPIRKNVQRLTHFFTLVLQMGPEEQIDIDRAEPVSIGSSAASDRGASLEGSPKTFFCISLPCSLLILNMKEQRLTSPSIL